MKTTKEQLLKKWEYCIKKSNNFTDLTEIKRFLFYLVSQREYKRELADRIQIILFENNLIPFILTHDIRENDIKLNLFSDNRYSQDLLEIINIIYCTCYINSNKELITPV